ncbi:hypothetical protein ACPCK1_17835 [Streptomyces pseudogriseolus]|uniref:hypothetical protein n=1 Tax=Streptomyces pseudogriseolus TaxID=36817 RepID=UPI003FA2A992
MSAVPYAYTDAQNHRLTFRPTTGATGRQYVWVDAENLAVGGATASAWLTIEQARALDLTLANRFAAEFTDHMGDTLGVRPADDFTPFEVTRAGDDDEGPETVRVVVLTGRLPEVRLALAAVADQAEGAHRPANELLAEAREAAADMFEVEVGERRPMWRVIYTDSESPTGVALVCTAEGADDEHHVIDDGSGGSTRDDQGVYDCCPSTQFETYSTVLAAYVVEVLNADAERGDSV